MIRNSESALSVDLPLTAVSLVEGGEVVRRKSLLARQAQDQLMTLGIPLATELSADRKPVLPPLCINRLQAVLAEDHSSISLLSGKIQQGPLLQ